MTSIAVVIDPSAEVVGAAIQVGLVAYNAQFAGVAPTTRFAVFVRDEAGTPVGGLEGVLRWAWLHVVNLWLPEPLRGQGLGSAVLREAEAFALARGCTASYLDTYEFQAFPFYERHGYQVIGVQEGFPPGHRRYYLQKELTDGSARAS